MTFEYKSLKSQCSDVCDMIHEYGNYTQCSGTISQELWKSPIPFFSQVCVVDDSILMTPSSPFCVCNLSGYLKSAERKIDNLNLEPIIANSVQGKVQVSGDFMFSMNYQRGSIEAYSLLDKFDKLIWYANISGAGFSIPRGFAVYAHKKVAHQTKEAGPYKIAVAYDFGDICIFHVNVPDISQKVSPVELPAICTLKFNIGNQILNYVRLLAFQSNLFIANHTDVGYCIRSYAISEKIAVDCNLNIPIFCAYTSPIMEISRLGVSTSSTVVANSRRKSFSLLFITCFCAQIIACDGCRVAKNRVESGGDGGGVGAAKN